LHPLAGVALPLYDRPRFGARGVCACWPAFCHSEPVWKLRSAAVSSSTSRSKPPWIGVRRPSRHAATGLRL